jgi:hypothetical protein
LIKALQTVYPEHRWEVWRFRRVSKGFWDNPNNASSFLQSVQDQLGLANLDEWNDVTQKHFQMFKGADALLKRGRSFLDVLKTYYPNHTWEENTRTYPSKAQVFMFKMIQELFPQHQVVLDFKREDLVYARTRKLMPLDVFIPDLNLAFEYLISNNTRA